MKPTPKPPLRRYKFTQNEVADLIEALEVAIHENSSGRLTPQRYQQLLDKLAQPKSLGYARSIIKRAIKNKGGKVSDYSSEVIENAAKVLMTKED